MRRCDYGKFSDRACTKTATVSATIEGTEVQLCSGCAGLVLTETFRQQVNMSKSDRLEYIVDIAKGELK